jgi:NO-binding membrane sensor protein with MHYT domain
MLQMLNHAVPEYDARLLGLAGLICLGSVATALHLYAKSATVLGRERTLWFAVTGLVAGAGIWTAHFVAMLALVPESRAHGLPPDMITSLLGAIAACAFAFWVAGRGGWKAAIAAGVILGSGMGLMHYLGLAVVRVRGSVLWDFRYVAASMTLGVGLAVAAFLTLVHNRSATRQAAAVGLLTLAICGMRLAAVPAVKIVLKTSGGGASQPSGISHTLLAVVVTTIAFCVIVTAAGILMAVLRGRRWFGLLRARRGGRRQHGQERIPGQYEPRDPHAHERRHRHELRPAAAFRSDRGAAQIRRAAISVSADCLLAIINDILDISKLEAGKVELEAVDFSLEKVVEDVVELLSPRAAGEGPGDRRPSSMTAPPSHAGDPTRLRQILLNLLSNASNSPSAAMFRSRCAHRIRERRHRACAWRSGHGIGLHAEAKSKLFQKFQQADGSITPQIRRHRPGPVDLPPVGELDGRRDRREDRRGGGSIFWVELTLPVGEAHEPARVHHDLKGLRILVVDDIELNRGIFTRQLEGEGAVVTEVDGDLACLRAMKRGEETGKPFDIVLLDHMMPDLGGRRGGRTDSGPFRLRQPKLVLASSIGAPTKSERRPRPASTPS